MSSRRKPAFSFMDRLPFCSVDVNDVIDKDMSSGTANVTISSDESSTQCRADDIGHISWNLTGEQVELIKRTWSDDFQFLFDLASSIYTYIFDNYPQAKAFFPHIHRHGPEWKDSEEYVRQSLSFVQSLSFIVLHISDVPCITRKVREVGRMHSRFASRGVVAAHFDILEGAISSALGSYVAAATNLTHHQKVQAMEAWKSLALFLAEQMKRGFSDELKHY